MLECERALWAAGHARVGGIDEAGRGPLAGPVVAACVVLPRRTPKALAGINDSKQLSEERREHFFPLIQRHAVAYGVGEATPEEIDAINILQATFLAMRRALEAAGGADAVLVDGNKTIPGLLVVQQAIVKGDGRVRAIAAASILAKVTRDRFMVALHEQVPHYGFAGHKGYGTAAHFAALREHGPSIHHRRSFLAKSGLV